MPFNSVCDNVCYVLNLNSVSADFLLNVKLIPSIQIFKINVNTRFRMRNFAITRGRKQIGKLKIVWKIFLCLK